MQRSMSHPVTRTGGDLVTLSRWAALRARPTCPVAHACVVLEGKTLRPARKAPPVTTAAALFRAARTSRPPPREPAVLRLKFVSRTTAVSFPRSLRATSSAPPASPLAWLPRQPYCRTCLPAPKTISARQHPRLPPPGMCLSAP
jgi:hypothetical protein